MNSHNKDILYGKHNNKQEPLLADFSDININAY